MKRRKMLKVLGGITLATMLLAAGCGGNGASDKPQAKPVAKGIEVKNLSSNFTGTMLGGYMMIDNNTDKDVAVVGAESPPAGEASLHLSTMENDIAKMNKVEKIDVPAGSMVELRQGGYHVMVKVTEGKKFKVGDEWELTLVLDNGEEINLKVPVTEVGAGMDMGGMENEGMEMKSDNMNMDGM